MASERTYLDYNASAPLLPEARAAMVAALDLVGNPSSVHAEGRRLRGMIEVAREAIADLVGAKVSEIVFTSGATEANVSVLARSYDRAFRAGIEHDSVLAPIRASGAEVVELPVDADGVIDVAAARAAIETVAGLMPRSVLALQLANNESGVIQPVAEIASMARAAGIHVHCDAVQACGRIDVDVAALGVDTLAVSAHKLGGPRGIGALVVRDGFELPALITGGGQERRRRAGTEDVAAIVGFGVAAAVAQTRGLTEMARIAALRDRLEAEIQAITPDAVVLGGSAHRLANTSAIAVPGRPAEITLIKLDLAGIAVSSGSACSSGKVGRSHVLAAMGIEPDLARGMIRISLGPATTGADVDRFIAAWRRIHDTQRVAAGSANPTVTIHPKDMAGSVWAARGMGD